MKVVFVINDDGYREVSKEEYEAFNGEKFFGPPFWRSLFVTEWLLRYRYM